MRRKKTGSSARVVLMTAPDERAAARLARVLLGAKLAACVTLVPKVRSLYRWKGNVHDDPEVLLIAKTRAARCPELRKAVRAVHPYEVPEIIELPVSGGFAPYLRWLDQETS